MKEKKTTSIRTHAMVSLATILILATVVVSSINLYYMNDVVTRSANEILNKECEIEVERINAVLDPMASAVETLALYVDQNLDRAANLTNRAYVESLTEELKALSLNIINNIDLCEAVYVRFNPRVTWATSGLFWTRKGNHFVEEPPTDILRYESTDIEHVGWYYTPINNGKAMWMDPYYNQNINVYMISYVVPLFKDGKEIGVVGMDINFDTICEMVGEIKPLDAGHAFLADSLGNVVYSEMVKTGTSFADVCTDFDDESADMFRKDSSEKDTKAYTFAGEKLKFAFATLTNGMKLCLSVPVSVIYREVREAVSRSIVLVLLFALAYVLFLRFLLRRTFEPILELSEVTSQALDNDFVVDIKYESKNEIGLLADNFRTLMARTRTIIHDIKDAANFDLFTGTESKLPYNERAYGIDDKLAEGQFDYAVFVFDVNNLKDTNDKYGHNMGDMLILRTAKILQKTFGDNPVYRTGGDEFVIILEGEEFEKRIKYLKEFDFNIAESNLEDETSPVDLVVARGMAVYDSELDKGYDDTFDRADKEMYKNKEILKQGMSQQFVNPGQ